MGHFAHRNRSNFEFHTSRHVSFDLVGEMMQNTLRNRDPRWRIAQHIALDNSGVQFGAIHVAAGTIGRVPYAAGASALAALRASSRATSFIIGDGAVWAFF